MVAAFRHLVRSVTHRPGISLLLMLTLAIAIGSTTTVFSVLDAVLLKPAPYAHAEQLAELWNTDPDGSSFPLLEAPRAEAVLGRRDLLTAAERYSNQGMLLGQVGDPAEILATRISSGFLPMLGVEVAEGRGILPDDTLPGAAPVAVVSQSFRERYLGGKKLQDSPIIRLDDRDYTVVGVMPTWFRYPRGIVSAWLPLGPGASEPRFNYVYVVRFRPGLDHPSALSALKALSAELQRGNPTRQGWGITPFFLDRPSVNQDVRTSLWLLATAVGCVLLVACANAAGLLLVQATSRHRELLIRSALGASRRQLLRQLLSESMGFALLGAIGGIGFAYLAVEYLPGLMPRELSVFSNSPLLVDRRVLLFGVLTGLLTWAACAIGPALLASRRDQTAIRFGRGGTGSPAGRRARNVLVVIQFALALVLLATTGLFLRSFVRLATVETGFDTAHLLTADFALPSIHFPTADRRSEVLNRLTEGLAGIPGVRRVTVTTGLPPSTPITFSSGLQAEGAPALGGGVRVIPFSEVDTGFFATMGIPVLRGRGFSVSDTRDSSGHVIVSQAMARTLWADRDPLGRRFRLDEDSRWLTVIGVAGEVKMLGPDDREFPFSFYYPRQEAGRATRQLSLAIETAGPPAAYASSIRETIRRISPDLPVLSLASAQSRFAEGAAKPRFVLLLLSLFAGLGLLLAVVGVYGVTAYAVLQRTREIGIRMALGADRPTILQSFLREGLGLAAAGAVLGGAGVITTSHLVAGLLYGVSPRDPVTVVAAVVLLLLSGVAGVLVPARRATRVDPMIAMAPD